MTPDDMKVRRKSSEGRDSDRRGKASLWVITPYEDPRPDEVPVVDPKYKRNGIASYFGFGSALIYFYWNEGSVGNADEFLYTARWVYCFALLAGLVTAVVLLSSAARRADKTFYVHESKTKTRFLLHRLFDAIIFALGWLLAQAFLELVHVGF